MIHSYYYGKCDLCKKEIDSRFIEKRNSKGFERVSIPLLILYPNKVQSDKQITNIISGY